MSRLSANTLFHFTPREYLLDKFENGFSPRYNEEFSPELDGEYFNKHAKLVNVNLETGERTEEKLEHHSIFIPMISFCDIPLSSLSSHMDIYSSYGIGLKKEWGEENRLNPITYVNESSDYFNVLSSFFVMDDCFHESTIDQINAEIKAVKAAGIEIDTVVRMLNFYGAQSVRVKSQVITHLKPRICIGKYKNKYENYSYYDEKEWRYIPPYASDTRTLIYNALSESELDSLNNLQKRNAITFSPKMVKYIIVKNDSDIEFVVNGLNEIKSRKGIFTDEDIHTFTTKIITREHINEDF